MSNHNYLRLVTLPPALASVTTRGLLPSPLRSKLFVALPNERCRQALHVRQLLGGASQLQSTFTDSLRNPNSPGFRFESFEFCVDIGQVVVQFAVARDIRSDAPVIESMGCLGEVSVNCRGTNE